VEARHAHARYVLGRQEKARRRATGDAALIGRICEDYLDHCKAKNRPSTYEKRGAFLWDSSGHSITPARWE
jgi:hypothetical protein